MDIAHIVYRVNFAVSVEQFIDILTRSTLGRRRPVDDRDCMEQVVKHTTLMVSAWDGELLVGIARSITDFAYACCLADLAVDERYERQGIGQALIAESQKSLGPRCTIRLISAPAAVEFYRAVGFTPNANCWERKQPAS